MLRWRRLFSSGEALLLALVLMLAAWLRVSDLDAKSFWLDEVQEADRYREGLWRVTARNQLDVHPPLRLFVNGVPFWLRYGFEGGGLPTEWELRLVPALLGVLTVGVFFCYLKSWAPRGMAALGALLLAVNPEHLEHSQDARMYSAYLLLALLLVWVADALAQRFQAEPGQPGSWLSWIFALLVLMNFANAYLAFFPVAGALAGLFCCLRTARSRPVQQLGAGLVCLLICLTYLGADRFFWRSKKIALGLPDLELGKKLLAEVRSEWWMSPAAPQVWQDVSCGLATSLGLLGLWGMLKGHRHRTGLLLAHLLTPLLFLLLVKPESFFSARYVLYLLPLSLVFIAHGLVVVRLQVGKVAAACLLAVFLGLQALALKHYFCLEKQNWRAAARQVVAELKPGQTAIILAGAARADLCLAHYLQRDGFSLVAPANPDPQGPYLYEFFLLRRGELEALLYPPTVRSPFLQSEIERTGLGLYLGSLVEDARLEAGAYPAVDWALQNGRRERRWPGQFPWSEVELRRLGRF